MEAIKTVNLTKKYGHLTAVDNLNLTVRKGELFSLLGVNGAGKTTAIKILSGLTQPTSGEIFVEGVIGVSPQETAVAPNLTVQENLALMCGIYGFSKKKTAEKIQSLSRQFQLWDVLRKKAGKLSGGWQRRVSIALALVGEPAVLFLDEPTLGLDVIARRELWGVIAGLKGAATIILTTHYMEEAEALSDRIGIMKSGKLLTVGTAKSLMAQTATGNFEDAFISIVQEA